jgi:hypothetical protein
MAIILEGKFKFPAVCRNAGQQEPDAPLLSCDAPSEGPGGCAVDPSLISWVGTWRYANRQSRTSFQYVYWGPAEQVPADASSTQQQQQQQQEDRPTMKLEPIMEADADTAAESSAPNESATASTAAVVVSEPAAAAQEAPTAGAAEATTEAAAAAEAAVPAAAAPAAAEAVKTEAAAAPAAGAAVADQRPNLTVDVTFAHIEAEAAEDEFMRGMPPPTPLAAEGSKPPAFDMTVYGIGADAQPPWGRWQGSFVVKNRGAKADQIVRESFELQQGEQGYSFQGIAGAPAATPGALPVRGVGRNLYGKFTLTGEYVAATGVCTLTRLYYSVQSAPTPRTQTPSAAGRKRKRPAPSSAATPRSDLASPVEAFSDQSIAERRPRRLRAPSVHTVGGAELEDDSGGEEPVRKHARVYRPKQKRTSDGCYGDDSADLDSAATDDAALLAQSGAAAGSLDPAAAAQQIAERTRATAAAARTAAEAQDPTEEVWRAAFLDDATGEVYEGGWHKGRRASLGACVFPNGNMYEGEWRRGREHGHGALMTGTRRVIYSGDWVDGKLCGRGTYNFPGGAVYTGDWRDNMRHGKGVYTLSTG